jgi:hypothetical protein
VCVVFISRTRATHHAHLTPLNLIILTIYSASRYGLDGAGIESSFQARFPHPSRPALGPTQVPIQWVSRLFPGVARQGRGVLQPPPSSAEVKKSVELFLHPNSGHSWHVLW